ncbi:hypothetical protein RM96_17080 [Cupriavidus sp. IDO]|nr:hypothetical protein RM96_17080 [Cupriavidus sp. IDO]
MYAFLALVVAYGVNTIPCMAVRSLATAVPCQPALPIAYAAWPILALIGCAVGAWRFYRDYYCGDIARDFYD